VINSRAKFEGMLKSIKSSKGYLVLNDEQVSQNSGYMRSLPLLTHFLKHDIAGVVGKPSSHECIWPAPVGNFPYSYVPVGTDDSLQIPRKTGMLCVYVHEGLDDQLHYVSECIEKKYPTLFITTKPRYIPAGWKKSGLTLEDRSEHSMDYLGLLKDYCHTLGLKTRLPMSTENLTFIELYYIHTHLTNRTIVKVDQLFDFEDPRLTISPIWDMAIKIAWLKEENPHSDPADFVFSSICPYIEKSSDLENAKVKILNLLSHYSFDWEKIKRYRDTTMVDHFSKERNRNSVDMMENSYLRDILTHQLEVET
jgi:hypothetical protein